MNKYADVIVNISHESVDRPFEYIIPEGLVSLVRPGTCVNIPFGRGSKLTTGYVMAVKDTPGFDPARLKAIDSVVKSGVTIESAMVELAAFIRETYGGTMNQALKTVLPVKKSAKPVTEKYICLTADESIAGERLSDFTRKKNVAKVRLLAELLKENILPLSIVKNKLNIAPSTMNSLEKEGLIRIDVRENLRDAIHIRESQPYTIVLNEAQRRVADDIWQRYVSADTRPSLIHGVTGSGKTEIYIDLIDRMIRQGRQAIVLIPEIALTYQTVIRFYRKFGDRVSIINSRMTDAQRYDQMEKARTGQIDIIIGPRSALFTPFQNAGIVIIDEEHEGTYHNEGVPRYDAREVAIRRMQMNGGIVVSGSATPSVESYFMAQNGKYQLYSLTERAEGARLPRVEIVDLRQELENGNRSMFSGRLKELMEEKLAAGEQIMLFINRRGHSSFVSCRSCGTPVKCPHCDVSLKYHRNGRLICHYCGYETPMLKACPVCGSKYIGTFGTGTQKVEEEVEKLFPTARVLRMDFDTTREKDGHEKILSAFADHQADILIGTQMIVKGHDFANVTLVGIIAADMSLYTGDYTSTERTFQLLTQAAGRAGRGEKPGEVVIQTYSPDNYAVMKGAEQDYNGFYEMEMQYRQLLGYPPVMCMMEVLLTSADSAKLERTCSEISRMADEYITANGEIKIMKIGPAEPAISRINDRYRKVMYLKSDSYVSLTKIRDIIEAYMETLKDREMLITFDFSAGGR